MLHIKFDFDWPSGQRRILAGKKVVATLAPSILIGSSSYLEVIRIAITSRMSLNFS